MKVDFYLLRYEIFDIGNYKSALTQQSPQLDNEKKSSMLINFVIEFQNMETFGPSVSSTWCF